MIEWLYSLQHFGIKLGLHNIRALLRVMGHPEHAFPSVLIAGTNGKGSVAAMLHSMLSASGLKPGLFSSPHLIRPTERIRIGDDDISGSELNRRLAEMKATIEAALSSGDLETHPSFFEVITATALEAFREQSADVALLEVGLGGRLDATNAVNAAASIIVSIDLDHVKSLGPTIEQIAREKGGIIKPNAPLISGVVRQRAISVLQRVARERDAEWIDARLALELTEDDGERIALRSASTDYPDLRLGLLGRHQIDNARVALAAFEQLAPRLGISIDPSVVRSGLASIRWPARLQWVRDRAGMPDLLIDGAHNPAGVVTLAGYLDELDAPPPVALFGAMQGKLLPEMLGTLGPRLDSIVLTRPDVQRAADPDEVAPIARRYARHVEIVPDPTEGLARAAELAGDDRFVLVAGSLFLAGAILALLEGGAVPGPVSM